MADKPQMSSNVEKGRLFKISNYLNKNTIFHVSHLGVQIEEKKRQVY